MDYVSPHLKIWLELGELLFAGAEAAAKQIKKSYRPRRRRSFAARHAGPDSALWNVLATLLRTELKSYGAKVRMARYLGLPRQRVTDFLTGGTKRLPDAELTLRLLHWLAVKRSGRDLSV